MNGYKKLGGKSVGRLDTYILDTLEKHPTAKIHVGTDSQKVGDRIKVATVVAFRYGNRGVHFIYRRENKPLFATISDRLRYEVEKTVDLILWFSQSIPSVRIEAAEVDVNRDTRFKSNVVYGLTKGWLEGVVPHGTKVLTKPDLMVAVRAANSLV